MQTLFLTNNFGVTHSLYDWLCSVEGLNNLFLWDKPLSRSLFFPLGKLKETRIIISYNYAHIIHKDIVELFKGKIINLHISCLPWNRGADPNFWSFIDDTPKGVTIHLVDEGVDTGDILIQKEMCWNEGRETFASTYEALHQEIQTLFKLHWEEIKNGLIVPRRQIGEGSTHKKCHLQAIMERFPVDWDDSILSVKKRLNDE